MKHYILIIDITLNYGNNRQRTAVSFWDSFLLTL